MTLRRLIFLKSHIKTWNETNIHGLPLLAFSRVNCPWIDWCKQILIDKCFNYGSRWIPLKESLTVMKSILVIILYYRKKINCLISVHVKCLLEVYILNTRVLECFESNQI